MIEAKNLHKRFGTLCAVDGVSFVAPDGAITGLLGPNGAGKTTTLRMLYTLMQPDRGQVFIDDQDAAIDPLAARRTLGVLPDARGLYKRLSARENIEYYAQLQGLSADITRQRIGQLIDTLGMQDFIERRTEGFSQGQRVKTAIARALVHGPRNVILDEPTNGLDVMATRGLREFIKQLKCDGHCVLFSTHIMQEVAALCDYIVIIAHGRVVAQGSADELRAQARHDNLEDAFVALLGNKAGIGNETGLLMSTVLIVFLKELRESLRDRRTLLNALIIGPLLGPVLFVVLTKTLIGREIERAEQPLPVVVIGADYAPNLVAALEQAGLERKPAIEHPEAAIRDQQVDLVLRIPSSYAGQWRAGKSAQVELLYDSSRREVNSQVQRLRSMLYGQSQLLGSLRVVARGLSPDVTRPIQIAERDQATPQARGALLFAMLPYFLMLTALMGGMFLAIDATAGERERQSLEPLLINPVARSHILLGKLAAISLFSLCSVVLGLAAFTVAGIILTHSPMNLPVVLDLNFALRLMPLMVPLCMLIATLQMLVTAFARSFREAQTWLGLLQLVPVVPLLLVSLLELKPELWMYWVPLLGQEVAALQLLRGASVNWIEAGACLVSTLAAALLVFALVRRVYASERLAIAA